MRQTEARAAEENILQGNKWRLTLLTDRLLRLEYSEDGVFEDRPTQTVLFRAFEPVAHRVSRQGEGIELFTDRIHLTYDGKPFSANGLFAEGPNGFEKGPGRWRYGDTEGNLKGTTRTLDTIDGACALEDGILSRYGYAVLEDGDSLLLTEDG